MLGTLLGRPVKWGDDNRGCGASAFNHFRRHNSAFSRLDPPEVCPNVSRHKNQRARGMPDARCTRGLVCKIVQKNAHEHTGSAEAIRHSLRNGFTAYFVLSPAIGLV